ncbi:MAG: SPOR domain-containing protein [Gammaproteobacteria bacterium]|nr:SPOR domain-containing protein [Gammaproteobacteria bacterium]MCF6230285.1 SPOR domain-containing protein [Gammaproteobacteria bacterium]
MESNRTKQRIVGAVIMLSIAVIVLPMILSESGEKKITGSNIPEKPDYLIKTEIIPLEIKALPNPDDTVQRRVIQEAHNSEQVAAEEPTTAATLEDIIMPSDIKPVAEPQPVTPPLPEPQIAHQAERPAAVSGWVVQVGSFSSQSNALALRDKLRGHGFSAFVERAEGPETVYRVRVGPEIKKEQAHVVKERLQEKLALDGLVIRHR